MLDTFRAPAEAFLQAVNTSVFGLLGERPRVEAVQAAQGILEQQFRILDVNLTPGHFRGMSTTHRCIEDVYRECCLRLSMLEQIQRAALPPVLPTPVHTPPPPPTVKEQMTKGGFTYLGDEIEELDDDDE